MVRVDDRAEDRRVNEGRTVQIDDHRLPARNCPRQRLLDIGKRRNVMLAGEGDHVGRRVADAQRRDLVAIWHYQAPPSCEVIRALGF